MTSILQTTICFSVLISFLCARSNAGGFDRFDQDVSLLFDPARTVVDVSGSYVLTDRHYETVDGKLERVQSLDQYPNGSFKLKQNISDTVDCLLSGGRPFGSEIDYGMSWSRASTVASQNFHVSELALTCSVKAPPGAGKGVRALVGGSADNIMFEQRAVDAAVPLTSQLTFEDEALSWRVGLAYEQPAARFSASLMYYAPIDFDVRGKIANVPLGPGVVIPSVPIEGKASIPQAIEARVQGVVAPGWLLGLGFKWMDWSELKHVPLRARGGDTIPAGTELVDLKTFLKDGFTAAAYLGHRIDDHWSILLRLGWDRATESGWTSHSETWALQTTVYYNINQNLEIRASVNAALLESGEINKGSILATWGKDFAIVPQIGLTVRY